jgi:hypothetical protein
MAIDGPRLLLRRCHFGAFVRAPDGTEKPELHLLKIVPREGFGDEPSILILERPVSVDGPTLRDEVSGGGVLVVRNYDPAGLRARERVFAFSEIVDRLDAYDAESAECSIEAVALTWPKVLSTSYWEDAEGIQRAEAARAARVLEKMQVDEDAFKVP